MNKIKKEFSSFFLLAVGVLLFSSCGVPKDVVYMSDLDSTQYVELNKAEFKEPLIQIDDILSISVQTIDQIVSSPVDQTGASPAGASTANGFLVDKSGNVEMPLLGTIKLAGLTSSQARELIRTKAEKYFKEPTVQIRFANYKITVLGEVNRPASYIMPSEKVSLFDAIALAGDLTIYGKRGNILLMRDEGNKKVAVRLDMTSSNIVASPYFYLKQNDVLYVEPSTARIAANNVERNRLISLGISLAAFAITIYSIFR